MLKSTEVTLILHQQRRFVRGQSTHLRSDDLGNKFGFHRCGDPIFSQYHCGCGIETPLEDLAFLHSCARKDIVIFHVWMSRIALCCRNLMVLQRAKTGDVWGAKIPTFQSAVKACGDKTFALKDETSATGIDGPCVGVPLCCDGTFTLWVPYTHGAIQGTGSDVTTIGRHSQRVMSISEWLASACAERVRLGQILRKWR